MKTENDTTTGGTLCEIYKNKNMQTSFSFCIGNKLSIHKVYDTVTKMKCLRICMGVCQHNYYGSM